MTTRKDQSPQHAPETSRPPRFRIEKLEERIAPAQGGIPGKPPYHYAPGKYCGYRIPKIKGYCGI